MTANGDAKPDFTTVTELAEDQVSADQVARSLRRYVWALDYCRGKDVLEIACGAGQGLGLLASVARSVSAGDIMPELVARVQTHYGARVKAAVMDAEALPFADSALDTVIMFEALYYVPNAEKFVAECRRVLRPGGVVLICNHNKDAPGFNPSPYSHVYHGVVDLGRLFAGAGFTTQFLASGAVGQASMLHRMLVPVKKAVVAAGLMPKTMNGKKLLKRIVFGKLVPMPQELRIDSAPYTPAEPIPAGQPNRSHTNIFCVATKS